MRIAIEIAPFQMPYSFIFCEDVITAVWKKATSLRDGHAQDFCGAKIERSLYNQNYYGGWHIGYICSPLRGGRNEMSNLRPVAATTSRASYINGRYDYRAEYNAESFANAVWENGDLDPGDYGNDKEICKRCYMPSRLLSWELIRSTVSPFIAHNYKSWSPGFIIPLSAGGRSEISNLRPVRCFPSVHNYDTILTEQEWNKALMRSASIKTEGICWESENEIMLL